MTRFLTVVLAALLATMTALGCSGEGARGKNSDKDRPKPAAPGN